MGRLLDPVINGRLPSAKTVALPVAEPTGINFIELLHQQKEEEVQFQRHLAE